jgi:hypothetical protein
LVQTSIGDFLVAHTAQNAFVALSAICTHQTCTITGFGNQNLRVPVSRLHLRRQWSRIGRSRAGAPAPVPDTVRQRGLEDHGLRRGSEHLQMRTMLAAGTVMT